MSKFVAAAGFGGLLAGRCHQHQVKNTCTKEKTELQKLNDSIPKSIDKARFLEHQNKILLTKLQQLKG